MDGEWGILEELEEEIDEKGVNNVNIQSYHI